MDILTQRGFTFAAKCYLAAVVAMGIAFVFGLANPWWASITVFITSQPLNGAGGAVWARAKYRLVGTMGGMAVAVILIPNFVTTPYLLMAIVAGWVGFCLYLSLLLRGPPSYAFMLAGYSVALVGLPSLNDPGTVFDVAVLRAEETGIGILCAAVVHSVVYPQSINELIQQKLQEVIRDTKQWIVDALDADRVADAKLTAERRQLAVSLSELDLFSRNFPYEHGAHAASQGIVWSLESSLIRLVPYLTAVEGRLQAIREAGAAPDWLTVLAQDARNWFQDVVVSEDPRIADASVIVEECMAHASALRADATWSDVLCANLAHRLGGLVETWISVLVLAHAARSPVRPVDQGQRSFVLSQKARVFHVDHGLAALSGLAAAASLMLTASFAMAIGWSQGVAAIGLASSSVAVFAFADDPRPFLMTFLRGTVITIPIAALFLFGVLPALDGFAMLAMALAPFYIGIGLVMFAPKHALLGFTIALDFPLLAAIQPTVQGDLTTFVNNIVALLGATCCSLMVVSLIRVVRAEANARRIVRAGWRELVSLLSRAACLNHEEWYSRMIDRQALLVPRMVSATHDERVKLTDALNDLRIGSNIVGLRSVLETVGGPAAIALSGVLAQVGDYFKDMLTGGSLKAPASLLTAIDGAIRQLLGGDPSGARTQAISDSAALRHNLFPNARGFQHQEVAV